jgi:outer membrane protein assembly factor BamB
MQTPIVVGDYLYCCKDNGVVTCFAARTGQQHYSERLGPGGRLGFTASSVAADGKIYFTSEEGTVYVVKAGPKFEILSTNDLGEPCMSTPAISEGGLFFRTKSHLIAIQGTKASR